MGPLISQASLFPFRFRDRPCDFFPNLFSPAPVLFSIWKAGEKQGEILYQIKASRKKPPKHSTKSQKLKYSRFAQLPLKLNVGYAVHVQRYLDGKWKLAVVKHITFIYN